MAILVSLVLFLIAAMIYLACGCLVAFIICKNGKENDNGFVSFIIFAWPVVLIVLGCDWAVDRFVIISNKLADNIIKLSKKNPK